MTISSTLRVAVVGAGPAGFFAAAELLKLTEPRVEVDLFDRLPAPYGLVRHGVAPDHAAIKAISIRYDRDATAAGNRFRLFGNVELGRDVTLDELRSRYDAIVLAFGAQSNRRMGIPGEELENVHPASVFVGWYNGHPDCARNRYRLDVEQVAVVGVGNVALDVARILTKPPEVLARTDISDEALEALRHSRVREVFIVGRQSQAQASYTPSELEELTEIPGCDLVVAPADRRLDPLSESLVASGGLEPRIKKNLQIVAEKALTAPRAGRRAIHLRFLRSPVAVVGEERALGLRVVENRLVPVDGGRLRIEPTGREEVIPCELVMRSIGYRVEPVAGVPFDEQMGTVPHERGQVVTSGGAPVAGLFVTGWAKRGPRGVIGTNKPDAAETVRTLLEAWRRGDFAGAAREPAEARDIGSLLRQRRVRFVTFSDWRLLDQLEIAGGREDQRPRRKFLDVPAMLEAIGRAKLSSLEPLPLTSSAAGP